MGGGRRGPGGSELLPCWSMLGTRDKTWPGEGAAMSAFPCSSPFSLALDRVEQATTCSHREIC